MTLIAMFSVFLVTIGVSLLEDSPRELGNRFERAQKLMVTGDFDTSIAAYEQLMETPGSALLRPDRVEVEVGEEVLPLKVAAAYQVASSYRRRAEEQLQVYWDSSAVPRFEDLRTAASFYRILAEEERTPETLRHRAAFQVGSCYFKNQDYREAIAASHWFVQAFPASEYRLQARYQTAWALFHTEQWERAAAEFDAVASEIPGTDRGLRSLFQLGEAEERMGRFERSVRAFEEIAAYYDEGEYGAGRRREELMRALREKLPVTRRELIGKGHLRAGDAYRHLDSLDTAAHWYRLTARRFPTDAQLLKDAYLRLAEMDADAGRVDEALAAYRTALEEVADPFFRALVQAEMMALAFASERFLEAAQMYGFYIDAFAPYAAEVGVPADRARLLRAESLRLAAQEMADPAASDSLYTSALEVYHGLLTSTRVDSLAAEALLGGGICLQSLDRPGAAREHYERLTGAYGATRVAMWGRLHLARLYAEDGAKTKALHHYEELAAGGDGQLRDLARVELAVLLEGEGKGDRALELLSRIGPESAEFGRAQMVLVRLLTARDRWAESRRVVHRALDGAVDPEVRAQLSYSRAEVAFEAAQYDSVIHILAALDTTLLQQPFVHDRLYLRGVARYKTGAYAPALDDLRAYLAGAAALRAQTVQTIALCLEHLMETEEAAEQLVRWGVEATDAGERGEWTLGLARLFHRQKDYNRAIQVLQGLESVDDLQTQRARLVEGEILLARQRWDAARSVLTEIQPDYLSPGDRLHRLYLVGIAAMNGGDYEGAILSFQALLARRTHGDLARLAALYLGKSYYTLGQHVRAAAVFEELEKRFPAHPDGQEAAYLAGDNYYLLEDFERAALAYQRVLVGPRRAEAMLALAWCHLHREDLAAMEETLELIQELFPKSVLAPRAAMMIADHHYNRGDYERARQAYKALIRRHPQSPEAGRSSQMLVDLSDLEADRLYQEAMATFDRGDYEAARVQLETVVQRFPGTLSAMAARCNIGVCYEKTGQWRRAVAVYDSLLQMEKVDPQYNAMVRFAREHRDWIRDYRL